MPQNVTLPDGSSIDFPDNMTLDQMKAAIYSQPQWKQYAPKVATSPTAAPPVDRKAVDKFRMDYFNTQNMNANAPIKTAHALALNPKDPEANTALLKMNPVSQQAIREKAAELANAPVYDAPQGTQLQGGFGQAPVYRDPHTGARTAIPSSTDVFSEAIKGPEGAKQDKLKYQGPGSGALNAATDLGLGVVSPQGLATGLAFGALGGVPEALAPVAKKIAAVGTGAFSAMMEHSAYQRYQAGDNEGAAFDAAMGIIAPLAHVKAKITANREVASKAAADALESKIAAKAKVTPPPESPSAPVQTDSVAPKPKAAVETTAPVEAKPVVTPKPHPHPKARIATPEPPDSPPPPVEKPTATPPTAPVAPATVAPNPLAADTSLLPELKAGQTVEPVQDLSPAKTAQPKPLEPDSETVQAFEEPAQLAAPRPLDHPDFVDVPSRPFTIREDLLEERAKADAAGQTETAEGQRPRALGEDAPAEVKPTEVQTAEPEQSTGRDEAAPEESKGLLDKLSDAADAARDRLGKPRLGSGIPADMLKDLAIVAADHMVKLGTRSYAAFEKSMIDEYGPEVRASLKAVYNAALQNHGAILPPVGTARPGTDAANALPPPPATPAADATVREGPVKATGAFRQMGKFGRTMLAGVNHIAGAWDLGKLDSEIAKRQIVSDNNLNASEKQQLSDYLLSNTLRARSASNPSFASDFGGAHPQMMTQAEEAQILSNPKIAAAVDAYKQVLPHFTAISMEEGLTPEVQAKLGEDYFPMHRLDPEGPVEGNGRGGSTQPVGQKLRTQKNRYTLHAGGNSPEYMSDIDSTLDQVYGHLTKLHAKNQFYRDAKALGYVADTPEQARDLWGSEYRGIEMTKTSDGKVITKYFPRDVEGMLRKALVTEPNIEHPTGVKVLQGFNKANMTMRLTFNIPELLGHGRAYPVQLRALPPKTMPFFGKLIQSIPYIGEAKVGKAMFDLDFEKPEMRQVLRDIYSAHGGSSRPFKEFQSSTIDEIPGLSQIQQGVHEGIWSLPEGKGFKGWDTRGAVYAEMIRRSYERLPDGSPDLDPARIREFQANFRQYMSHPDWWIRGISSFHPTAKTGIPKAMSMLKQTAGVSGIHSASTGDAAALAAQTVAMRTVAPAVTALLINRALSGHWNWQNKPGHKWDIQFTHDGPNAVYGGISTIDPALSYAMTVTGLHARNREQGQKPWSNKTKGKHQGAAAQQIEDIGLGALNLGLEQTTPPALDTAIQALTGKALYFQRKPAGYQPEMVQTTDPKAQLGARALQAFMQTFGPTSTLAGAENNPNRPQGLAWALLNYTLASKQLKVDPHKKVHPQ